MRKTINPTRMNFIQKETKEARPDARHFLFMDIGLKGLIRYLSILCLLISFSPNTAWGQYTNETLPAGSVIIDMGQTIQTQGNTLAAYGLIYELISNQSVPVKWIINPDKTKDGTDFIYQGVPYRGGPFIIPGEFVFGDVEMLIANWNANNGTNLNLVTTTEPITVPVYTTISYYPTWTLDQKNGSIAESYIEAAGIPPSAYNFKDPQALDCCDQLFAMPHADPVWETHSNLFFWNEQCNGGIWAACHAVSALENMYNPSDFSQQTNFLSTTDPAITMPAGADYFDNSLLLWGDHGDPSTPPPYIYNSGPTGISPAGFTYEAHPTMQFLGGVEEAVGANGSESIYLPRPNTMWRNSTAIGIFDDSQEDVMDGLSPGEAALVAFGDAFGETTRGRVMYEAGHNHSGGDPDNIAAQRIFHNFSLWALEKTSIAVGAINGIPDPAVVQNTAILSNLSVNATGGTGVFSYEWQSSCGGTFSNPGGQTTDFDPPFTAGPCLISVIVQDECGTRTSFTTATVEIVDGPPTITPTPIMISSCEDKCIENVDLLADVDFSQTTYPYSVDIISITGSPALGANPGGGFAELNMRTTNNQFSNPILLKYFPEQDYAGTVTITYQICDDGGVCNTNTLDIMIEADGCPAGQVCNQPPVASMMVTFADNFNGDRLNALNSGTLCWSGNWTERDQGVIGPLDFANMVTLQNNNGGTVLLDKEDGDYIERVADLSGATQVTLNFQHLFNFNDDDKYTLLIDPDGAGSAPFIKLDSVIQTDPDNNSAGYVSRSIDVDSALQAFNTMEGTSHTFGSGAILRIVETGLNTDKAYVLDWIELDITAGSFTGTYRDDFTNNGAGKGGYDQQTASSECWGSTWVETGEEGSPYAGDINLSQGGDVSLHYKTDNDGITIKSISRTVDLSPYDSATLSFDLVAEGFDGGTAPQEEIYVEYFDGTSWIRLQTFEGATPALGTYTFTLEDKGNGLSSASAIRITDNAQGAKDLIFDNFVIEAVTPEQTFCSTCTVCEDAYPVAQNDQVNYPSGASSVMIAVLADNGNGVDTEPNSQALTVRLDDDLMQAGKGLVTTDGMMITYTPDAGTSGNDTFEYRLCDPDCYCDVATVTIVRMNQPPVDPEGLDQPPALETCEPAIFDVLADDTDPDGDLILITGFKEYNSGTPSTPGATTMLSNQGAALEVIDGGLRVRYIPPSPINFSTSPDYFWYTVCDNGTPQGCTDVLVEVTFDPGTYTNLMPMAVDDVAEEIVANQASFIPVLSNDTDPEAFDLQITSSLTALKASLVYNPSFTDTRDTSEIFEINNASGQITYYPPMDYLGQVQFNYKITDVPMAGNGCNLEAQMDSALVTQNIVNQRPVANNDLASVSSVAGETVDIDVLNNDFDPDAGNTIAIQSFMATTVPGEGTYTFNDGGTPGDPSDDFITFDPVDGFTGTSTFNYSICDDVDPMFQLCDTAMISVRVTGPIDLEVTKSASPATLNIGQTTQFTINLYNNNTTSDGKSATLASQIITATGVRVRDLLPAGISYSSTVSISKGSYDPISGAWFVGNVVPGEVVTLVIEGVVNDFSKAKNIAQVTAADQDDIDSTPNNDDGDQSEDDEAAFTVQNAGGIPISVEKVAVGAFIPGEEVTYEIFVRNTSTVPADVANPVKVTDDFINDLTNVMWTLSFDGAGAPVSGGNMGTGDLNNFEIELNPGETATFTVTGTLSLAYQQDEVPNTASASYFNDSSPDDNVSMVNPPVQNDADLSLTKDVTYNAATNTATFTITVSNAGPDLATNVVIEDIVPSGYNYVASSIMGGDSRNDSSPAGTGLTWNISSLAVGAGNEAVLSFEATVNASGDFTNIAQVTASDQMDPDSSPNNNMLGEDDQDSATLEVADLSLTKDVEVNDNGTVTFTIVVRNDGPDDASGVIVSDFIPDGYTNITNISSGGMLSGSMIIWDSLTISAMPGADSIALSFDATLTNSGNYENVVQITASNQADPDSAPNNDVANEDDQDSAIPPIADLSLDKTVMVNPDGTVTFTVTVTNEGPDAATGVIVTDSLPDGYTNITNISGGGMLNGSTISWDSLSIPFTSGLDTAIFTFDATLTNSGNYENVVQITDADQADPDSNPNNSVPTEDDQSSATPMIADLRLDKTVSVDSTGTISFTITVTNDGPDNATGVTIEDVVPDGYTDIRNISMGGIRNDSVITWSSLNIPATMGSNTITLSFDATMTQTGNYENVAQVTASNQADPDSNPNNDMIAEDDQDSAVPMIADLRLDKSVVVNNDGTVTFTIIVNNDGPDAASGVAIEDVLPDGYTNITNISSGGMLNGSTVNWTGLSIAVADSIVLSFDAAITGTGNYDNFAQVTDADQADPDSNPNNDNINEDDFDSAMPMIADLRLDKSVSINEDGSLTFTIVVTNDGPDTATGVAVADMVPDGYTNIMNISGGGMLSGSTITWDSLTIPTTAGSNSITLSFDANQTNSGNYVNVAQIIATDQADPDSDPNNNDGNEDDQDTAQPAVADLSLAKTVSVNQDGTLTFSITLTNNGPDNATGVAVTDVFPDGYTGINNISNGGILGDSTIVWTGLNISATAGSNVLVLTFDATLTGTGNYENVAQVTDTNQSDPDSNPNNNVPGEDDQDSAIPMIADLSLDKSVSVNTTDGTVQFSITVTNSGPDLATGVDISDVVPDGYTNISNISGGGVQSGSTITWTNLSIPATPGSNTTTFTFDATLTQTGNYENVGQVTAADQADPDSKPGNNNLNEDDLDRAIPEIADLSLMKSVAVNGDGTVTFTIVVTNSGPDNATGVTVEDVVPNGYSGISNISGMGTLTGSIITWDSLSIPATMGSNSITLSFDASVNPSGDYTNVAQITTSDQADPDSNPNNGIPGEDDQDSSNPMGADLSLTKDVQVNGDGTVTFTIVVTNSGPDNATGVSVRDEVPDGYTAISNISNMGMLTGSTITWNGLNISALSGSNTLSLTFDATLTNSGNYRNVAQVDSTDQIDPDSNPGNNVATEDDQDAVDLEVADLSLNKSVIVNDNGTVTFNILVTNNGPNNATGVDIEDVIPDGYTNITNISGMGIHSDSTILWENLSIPVVSGSNMVTLSFDASLTSSGNYENVAQVKASDQVDLDSAPGNNDPAEDDQSSVTPPIADLRLDKAVTINGDGTVSFMITLTNDGPNDATGVSVEDIVPDGFSGITNISGTGSLLGSTITWDSLNVSSLAGSNSILLSFDAMVTGTGNYTNMAEVTESDQADPDSRPGNHNANEDDQASATPEVADLSLTKQVRVNPNGSLTFMIMVTNNGPDDATGVMVTDTVPDGYSSISNVSNSGVISGSIINWSGLNIPAAMDSNTITLTFDVTANDMGSYENKVEVTDSDQADPDSTPNNNDGNEDDQDNITPPIADLSLMKDVMVNPDGSVSFAIAVTNNGPDAASGVAVKDIVPDGYTNITNISGMGVLNDSMITWTGLNIPATAGFNTILLTFDAMVTGTGNYENVAQVSASNQVDPDSDPNNNVAGEDDQDSASPQIADLSLVKDVVVNADGTVSFVITITNLGPDAATNVSVEDVLPTGFTYINGSIASDVTASTNVSIAPMAMTTTLSWSGFTVPASLSSNTATLTFDAALNDTGDYSNVAQVTSSDQADPDSTPNNNDINEDDEDRVRPEIADLSLDKSVMVNNNGSVTFTIRVSNAGPDTARGVSIKDVVPDGYTGITNISNSGSLTVDTVEWNALTIPNGGLVTLSFDASLTGTGNYENIAQVSMSNQADPDSDPANDDPNEDDQDSAIPPVADLSLSKVATVNMDGTVTFTITVRNDGPNNASGVVISDTIPDGFTNISNISGTGSIMGSTITWSNLSIPNGSSTTLSFDARVTGTGNYENIAQVVATNQADPDSSPNNNVGAEDDQDSAIPGVSDLSLNKMVRNNMDGTLTFTIAVSNAGPDAATGVVVSDTVPDGYSNIANVSNSGALVGSTITWSNLSIPRDSTLLLSFDVTLNSTGNYENVAQVVAADQADPDSAPNNNNGNEDDQDSETPEIADLSLVKNVRYDASSNRAIFTLTLLNSGPNTATNIAVTDVIVPSGYVYVVGTIGSNAGMTGATITPTANGNTLSWTIDALDNGESVSLFFEADINESGEYVNIAQVTASDQADFDSTPDNNVESEDDQDNATLQIADLSLTKEVSYDAGTNTATFTLTVTNTGPDVGTFVGIRDIVPSGFTYVPGSIMGGDVRNEADPTGSGLTWNISSIGLGTSNAVTLSFEATVNTSGDFTNSAQITRTDQADLDSSPNNNDPNEDDQDSATLEVADLSLRKEVMVNADGSVTFILTLNNAGPDGATGVSVSDTIPDGYTGIMNISNGGALVGSTVSWSGLSIASGDSISLSYEVFLTDSGNYLNAAEIMTSDQADPDSAPNNDVPSEDDQDSTSPMIADLSLNKDVVVNQDGSVTFTITIRNAGPDTATGVVINDLFPDGYTSISNISNGGSQVGSSLTWSGLSLASGDSILLNFDAELTNSGNYENVAQVAASNQADPDSNPGNDDPNEDDQDRVSPQIADLSLNKSVIVNADGTVTFTLALSNAGPNTATGIVIRDQLPSGYTYLSDDGAGTYTAPLWSIDSLENDSTVVLNITASLNDGIGLEYVNRAEVINSNQADPDSNPDNDDGDQSEDDESSARPSLADLSLTKDMVINPDGSVRFEISLFNSGPDTATGVQVTDVVSDGYMDITNISNGGSLTGTTVMWSNLVLASGDSIILSFEAMLTGTGNYDNEAQITATDQADPDSDPNNNDPNEDDQDSATPGVADLSLDKEVAVNADGSVTFLITISNAGPDLANGIGISDVVPDGYTNINNVSNGGTQMDSLVSWSGLMLASGNSLTLSFDAVLTNTGNYLNEAQITATDQADPDSGPNNNDPNEDDQDSTRPGVADLSLDKTVVVNADGTVTFRLELSNVGPDTATGIIVEDQLPDGYTFLSDDGMGSYVAPFWRVDTLANNATAVLQITASVNDGVGLTYENVAQVVATDQADPNSNPNNDDGDQSEDDEASALPSFADLRLSKELDYDASSRTASFTIILTNDGPDSATNVMVEDVVPNGYTYVSFSAMGGDDRTVSLDPLTLKWTVNNLASGDSVLLTYQTTVNEGNNLDYTNTAQVIATDQVDVDSDPNNNDPNEDDQDSATLQVSDLSLDKSVLVNNDGSVSFIIVVHNSGPSTATNVAVTDVVPSGYSYQSASMTGGNNQDDTDPTGSGLVWMINSIAANDSAVLRFEATVNETGNYQNTAQVTALDQRDPDSVPGNDDPNEDDQDSAVPGLANLSLSKEATVNMDGSVTFTITVSNSGPDAATNVGVTDVLASGYSYQAASIMGGDSQDATDPSGAGLLWTINSLAANASVQLSFMATVNETGDYENIAQITATDQADPNSDPNNDDPNEDDQDSARPELADLSLNKTVVVNADGSVTFTIEVSNAGMDSATNIEITDILSDGYTYVPSSIMGGDNQDDTDPSGTGLVWNINSLSANASVQLRFDAQLNESGSYQNTAEISAVDQLDPNSEPGNGDPTENDQDSETPPIADLSMMKVIRVNPDSTVTFTISVTNNGPDAATGVVVEDQLPNGYTYLNDDGAGAYMAPIWTVGNVLSGTTVSLNITASVNFGPELDYENVAQVIASNQADPNSNPDNDDPSEDDQDSASVEIADLSLIKTAEFNDESGDGLAQPGETIAYTFTLRNEGNVDLSNVDISDPLFESPNPVVTITGPQAGEDVGADAVLGVGETWTYQATYTLRQTDLENGQVVNQAVAEADDPQGEPVRDLSDDDQAREDDPTVTEFLYVEIVDPCNCDDLQNYEIGEEEYYHDLLRVYTTAGETVMIDASESQGVFDNAGNMVPTDLSLTEVSPGVYEVDIWVRRGLIAEIQIEASNGLSGRHFVECNFSCSAGFACRGLVNITLLDDCSFALAVHQVITDAEIPNSFRILVDDNFPANGNVIDGAGLFRYAVVNGNQSICWGMVRAEDKTGPEITAPADVDDLECWLVDQVLNNPGTVAPRGDGPGGNDDGGDGNHLNDLGVPTIIDNCSSDGLPFTFDDKVIYFDCDSTGLFAVITRTFRTEDANGMVAVATQQISFRGVHYSEFAFEQDTDDSDGKTFMMVDGNWVLAMQSCAPDTMEAPIQYPVYEDAFGQVVGLDEIGCDRFSLNGMTNVLKESCGKNYKAEQTFKLFDWCVGESVSAFEYRVKVGDFAAPERAEGACDGFQATEISSGDTLLAALNGEIPSSLNAATSCGVISTGPMNCTAGMNISLNALETRFGNLVDDCSDDLSSSVGVYRYAPERIGTFPTGDSSWMESDFIQQGDMIMGLAEGLYALHLSISDGCNNRSNFVLFFEVMDLVKPVMKCEDELRVTLSEGDEGLGIGGYGLVTIQDVDAGSWDNCALVNLEVRRSFHKDSTGLARADWRAKNDPANQDFLTDISGDENAGDEYTPWADFVEFFCADLTETGPDDGGVRVELRGTDRKGNQSTCWLDVEVENGTNFGVDLRGNPGPVSCTVIPVNVEDINEDFINSLGVEAVITGVAGCQSGEASLDIDLSGLNRCGIGIISVSIDRSSVNTVGFKNPVQISDRVVEIEVVGDHDYWLKFPADEQFTCSEESPQGVEFEAAGCDMITIYEDDELFASAASPNACYKIFRTYRVINWCEYDGESQPVIVSRDWDAHNATDCTQNRNAADEGINPRTDDAGEYNLNPLKPDGDGLPGDEDIYVIVDVNNRDLNPTDYTNDGETEAIDGELDIVYYDNNSNPYDNSTAGLFGDDNNNINEGYWWAVVRGETACGTNESAWYDDDTDPANPNVNGNDGADDSDNRYGSYGYWQYTQHISVSDDSDPEATIVVAEETCTIDGEFCDADVSFTVTVTDPCSTEFVEVSYAVDGLEQGLMSQSDTAVFTATIVQAKVGVHELTVTVKDGCGNRSSTTSSFTVVDCKGPAPICQNGIIVELMPTPNGQGLAEAWATDLIASPIDDCTALSNDGAGAGVVPDSAYRIFRDEGFVSYESALANTNDPTGIFFTCADAGTAPMVRVYAEDAAGNIDYCLTFVEVQDNNNVCASNAETGVIAGLISTEEVYPIEGAEIHLSGQRSMMYMTDVEGDYLFEDIAHGYDYSMTPLKDNDHRNGVSTFDLILIQKHILGTDPLGSPYKLIAADANNSKSISTLDLIQIRKLILNVEPTFQNNTSWRFVESSYKFPDSGNPWLEPFPEIKNINNLDRRTTLANFIGVKIGDVNGSAVANSEMTPQSRGDVGVMSIRTEEVDMKQGNIYTVSFKAELQEIAGYQFTLEADPSKVQIVDVYEGVSKAINLGIFKEEGKLTTSFNRSVEEKVDGKVLFSLRLRANSDAALSEAISINSSYTRAEAYTKEVSGDHEYLGVELTIGNTQMDSPFELYQNRPNPFLAETVISFELPEAMEAVLEFKDVSGRTLFLREGDFSKGYNEIRMKANDFPSAGVYFYTLHARDFTATRKLIVTQ